MTWLWASLAGYFAIGICVSILLYQREQGGWVWTVLLWPLALILERYHD